MWRAPAVPRDRADRPRTKWKPGRHLPLLALTDLLGLGVPAWLVYASSMNSTPPSARWKVSLVLMAVPPTTCAT
ncbi:sugar transferase, partial [Streptomyces clavifer]